ncbi:MAG: haloacid dehalogenase type II [Betaproteobacteria bacterium]|nr:haloacid dehalogenase type II [Betaproteobacteria bacterium]
MSIKAVVFDAYGTLFDVYSVGELAEFFFPGHGTALSQIWRDKQIEYTRLITQSDPHNPEGSKYYLPFEEITRRALRYAAKRLSLVLTSEQEAKLMEVYNHLVPFPENLSVLKTLKEKKIHTAILSNGSREMLDKVVKAAGFDAYLDAVLTIEPVKLFKTAPETYSLALKQFSYPKEQILFVSSNGWDALGATWFGFKTCWVNRYQMPLEEIGEPPSKVGSQLTDILELLD